MSKRHHDQTQRCDCGAEIPDGHGTCESCLNRLSIVLGEMTWLDEQLDVSISRQHGAGTTGGAVHPLACNHTQASRR